MGVKGLLKELRGLLRRKNVYYGYRSKTLAVDSFVWLHQLSLHYAEEIQAEVYENVVAAFIERALVFVKENVSLLFVFDGGEMPGKVDTNYTRNQRRVHALSWINSAEAACDHEDYQASLEAAICITPKMKFETIKAIRQAGFAYIVAPYEADSQIAHLVRVSIVTCYHGTYILSLHVPHFNPQMRTKAVDGCITVDSDLVLHEPNGNVLLKTHYASGWSRLRDLTQLGKISEADASGLVAVLKK